MNWLHFEVKGSAVKVTNFLAKAYQWTVRCQTVKLHLLLVCVCVLVFVSCLSLIVIVQSDE